MIFKTALIITIAIFAGAGYARCESMKYSPGQYLKNFALCTCISEGYKYEEVVKDTSAGAGGYLELGSLPFEAYEEATILGRKFLEKEYKSKSGEKLILMKCIDFYHSIIIFL